jgi:hypothetical protein
MRFLAHIQYVPHIDSKAMSNLGRASIRAGIRVKNTEATKRILKLNVAVRIVDDRKVLRWTSIAVGFIPEGRGDSYFSASS